MKFFSKSDLLQCAKPNNELNCEENYAYSTCDNLKDAKYKNNQCLNDYGQISEFFECLNRVDKRDIMFNFDHPPVFQSIVQETLNLNTLLDFDETGINCGEFKVPYEDFYTRMIQNGSEDCFFLNGGKLKLYQVWDELIQDFSFNMSNKFDLY